MRVDAWGGGLAFGRPERLFEAVLVGAVPGHSWDVAPDGRFLVVKLPDEAERRAWFEKVLADRIHVDISGLPALLTEAGKKPCPRVSCLS